MRNKGKSIVDFPNQYIIIDIETTGLSTEWDEIIEIGALKISNGSTIDTFSELVKPKEEIDSFITELTGITNEELSKADDISTVLPRFKNFIQSEILVGHNVNFDINFLYDYFRDCIEYEMHNDYIDTMRIARKLLPELNHHRLDDLISYYSIQGRDIHRALGDCEKTFSVFQSLKNDVISKYSDIESFVQLFSKKHCYDLTGIKSTVSEIDIENPFYGKVCVFTGALEKMTRKEAAQIVANLGGINANSVTKKTNFLILGNTDYSQNIKDGKSNKQKKAEGLILAGQDLVVIPENVFYEMISDNK